MSFAQKERERLGDLLLEVGPDAPTLNGGWVTRDLATHLLIRERRPWAAPGILISAAEPLLKREEKKLEDREYNDVVRTWAGGPPAFIAPFNAAMNTAEHFIHHEDVRRGGGSIEPREFSAAVNKDLMKWVKRFGSLALRSSDVPVVLTPPTLPPVTVGGSAGVAERGDDVLRVSGEPGELLLWVSGRDAVVVEFSGRTDILEELERGI